MLGTSSSVRRTKRRRTGAAGRPLQTRQASSSARRTVPAVNPARGRVPGRTSVRHDAVEVPTPTRRVQSGGGYSYTDSGSTASASPPERHRLPSTRRAILPPKRHRETSADHGCRVSQRRSRQSRSVPVGSLPPRSVALAVTTRTGIARSLSNRTQSNIFQGRRTAQTISARACASSARPSRGSGHSGVLPDRHELPSTSSRIQPTSRRPGAGPLRAHRQGAPAVWYIVRAFVSFDTDDPTRCHDEVDLLRQHPRRSTEPRHEDPGWSLALVSAQPTRGGTPCSTRRRGGARRPRTPSTPRSTTRCSSEHVSDVNANMPACTPRAHARAGEYQLL